MITEFQTARLDVALLAERSVPEDALRHIVTPAVTQHLPPDLHSYAHPNIESWLKRLSAESTVFSIHAKGELIGFLTLHEPSATRWMLGYLLAQSAWGQGYASELVSGLVAHLHDIGWRGQVTGGVAADNPASARVLIKPGFEKAREPRQAARFILAPLLDPTIKAGSRCRASLALLKERPWPEMATHLGAGSAICGCG